MKRKLLADIFRLFRSFVPRTASNHISFYLKGQLKAAAINSAAVRTIADECAAPDKMVIITCPETVFARYQFTSMPSTIEYTLN